jgi:hypothetical protein
MTADQTEMTGWAFSYNVAVLPLAAAGLLNPRVAAGDGPLERLGGRQRAAAASLHGY